MSSIKQLSYSPGVDDPKEVIMANVRDYLPALREILGTRVLVALAPSPDTVGRSGLILATDKTKDESRWQGKVGLVLKIGVEAFHYNPRYPAYHWTGPRPEVGDWVSFFNSDTREVGVGGVVCRYVLDEFIHTIVDDPEVIY